MRKILLSTTNEEESRIAVIENGRLNDYLSVISGQEDRGGSIFCGIVSEIEPSLQACFVDIGDNRKGFLQFGDIHQDCLLDKEGPTDQRLEKGQPILVQITKDSRSEKGALLTTRTKIKSNHMVLLARERTSEGLRISRKASDIERERIQAAKDRLNVNGGKSIIVRSNGLDRAIDSLAWEKDSLLSLWELILKVFEKQSEPTLIYEYRNIVNICISEHLTQDTDELVCDSEATAQEITGLLKSMESDMVEKVRCVEDDEALFDKSVLSQIDSLLSRKVSLTSGGEIVIDSTEALTAIDVNSKRSRNEKGIEETALNTNLEAATEIALQLRLRNISGLIVVDFIDMENQENREKVENQVRRCLRNDSAQTSHSNLSQFGLLEMTRQYIGRPLIESHSVVCKSCDGTGRLPTVRSFANTIIDKIQDLCINRKQVGRIYVELAVDPATYILNEKRSELIKFLEVHGVDVIILPSAFLKGNEHKFRIDKQAHPQKLVSYQNRMSEKKNTEQYGAEKQSKRLKSPAAISSIRPSAPNLSQAKQKNKEKEPIEKTAFSLGKFLQNFFQGAASDEGAKEKAGSGKTAKPQKQGKKKEVGAGVKRQQQQSSSKRRRRKKPAGQSHRGQRATKPVAQEGDAAMSKQQKDKAPAKERKGKDEAQGPVAKGVAKGVAKEEQQHSSLPKEARDNKPKEKESKALPEKEESGKILAKDNSKAPAHGDGAQGKPGEKDPADSRPNKGNDSKTIGVSKAQPSNNGESQDEKHQQGIAQEAKESFLPAPEAPKTAEKHESNKTPADLGGNQKTPNPKEPVPTIKERPRRDRGNTIRKT